MKEKRSITINFTIGPVADMLEQIATSYAQYCRTPVKPEHNRIMIPRSLGTGIVECRELFDGLSCIICDVTYQRPAQIIRYANAEEMYYVIGCRYGYVQPHFTDTSSSNSGIVQVNSDCIFVHTSQLESSFRFIAGQRYRTFTVIMNRKFAMEELRFNAHPPNHSMIQDFSSNKPFSSISPLPLLVQQDIDQTVERLYNPTPADYVKRTALIGCTYRLISEWYLHFFSESAQEETYYPSGMQEVIKVKDQYIGNFAEPPLTIEELARRCNMSVTKFKHVFKSLFGMSCYQYYQVQRMEYAKQLLGKQQYSIKEVAYMTGFQNTANFTRSFKKAFDILPRDFQRVVKNMES